MLLASLSATCLAFSLQAAGPDVSNVRAAQRPGTKLVDIYYNLTDPDSSAVTVNIQVSHDGGATWTVPAVSFTGAIGGGVSPGVNKYVVWDAGRDWDGQFTSTCRVRVVANDADPEGFALIPAGTFVMGDTLGDWDPSWGSNDEVPAHQVELSAFYIEKTEVRKELWDRIYRWALDRGYSFKNRGAAKATGHPVHTVNWFDAVKWCNARSESEGRRPVYYVGGQVYRTGQTRPAADWTANGYRLPTEAEWEKAARGGLAGKRFPWGDTITHLQANYRSMTDYWYDTSLTRNYHPVDGTGDQPWTSPVGAFQPNGYGLFDVAGNLWEWCWDWYGASWYSDSAARQKDTRGPATGDDRVLRGGAWYYYASYARCANRLNFTPTDAFNNVGFRCVRGL